ncbi:MAG: murein endopeptidase [Deltaproteobacteria bacterium]|nr:MAG: murein endopeptidase [Deltaproteobacteria bacterium]
MAFPRIAALVGIAVALGCAGRGLWTDLGSVAEGRPTRGRLRNPAAIPTRAPGLVVPDKWRARGYRYGTDELVAAVRRAAAAVRRAHPGAVLGVADLSPPHGSAAPYHRSHQGGRDVDLLFYVVDARGRPRPPPADMVRFGGDGRPRDEGAGPLRFDDARNWALVEALLTDPSIRVQWIFVSRPLADRLLDHGRRIGRPAWIVALARAVLHQPRGSPPHDDHFHLRIYCPRSDRALGCEDAGPVWRHEKKRYKYAGPERYDPVAWRAAFVLARLP